MGKPLAGSRLAAGTVVDVWQRALKADRQQAAALGEPAPSGKPDAARDFAVANLLVISHALFTAGRDWNEERKGIEGIIDQRAKKPRTEPELDENAVAKMFEEVKVLVRDLPERFSTVQRVFS